MQTTLDHQIQKYGCITGRSKTASALNDGSYLFGISTPVGHVELSPAVPDTLSTFGFSYHYEDIVTRASSIGLRTHTHQDVL